MIEEKLISVAVENNMIAVTTMTTLYIEVIDEAIECSFQSIKVVNATFLGEGSRFLTPRLLKVTRSG